MFSISKKVFFSENMYNFCNSVSFDSEKSKLEPRGRGRGRGHGDERVLAAGVCLLENKTLKNIVFK